MQITLHELRAEDIPRLAATDGGAAWKGRDKRWQRYLADQSERRRVVLLAETAGGIVAYGSLVWASQHPHFRNAGIPEIQDLVVAQRQRRAGLGTRMIRALEGRARAAGCTQVGLGVGLYRDYGAAQRLYQSLGYLPDGEGVSYHNAPVTPGATVKVDDHLVLWLVRELKNT